MPFGHGTIDYVVVIACVIISCYLLSKNPRHLLLFLPTFVTIDFFIPFISHLTPGRLIPLVIGSWWIYSRHYPHKAPLNRWLIFGAFCVIAATAYGLLQGNLNLRTPIRALSYVGVLILCGFTWQYARPMTGLTYLLQGFALAGLVHGFYAIFQVTAHTLGLPYRGIVYSASGVGSGAVAGGSFRINGFADEPKRLGLILLAATISFVYLATREKGISAKLIMHGLAALLLIMSVFTFSTSYLVALLLWVPVMLLLSRRSWNYGMGIALLGGFLMIVMADTVTSYVTTQHELLESREREMDQGLNANKVYRQEFFAEDYLKENPLSTLLGVGMGRYYEVLSRTYGAGAGIGLDGSLLPLNSQAFEIVLDLGLLGLLLVYAGGFVIFWQVRGRGTAGYFLAALISFQLIQSFFIQSLPIIAMALGCAAALLWNGPTPHKKFLRQGKKYQSRRTREATDAISSKQLSEGVVEDRSLSSP
jgi:hypothetical protein